MTLATMYGLASQRLNEGTTPVLYPKAEIVAALNEGLRFFVLLTLCLETTQPWTVTAATTFFRMLTIFPDWIVPLRVTTATGQKVRPARLDELTSLDSRWIASPGNPYRYTSMGSDLLGLYQQPAAGGTVLSVTYARAPVPLVSDADVPEIPAEYHPPLVDYGIYRLRQGEGANEFAKALPLFDSFIAAATKYGKFIRARNLAGRYDKVPFELELFDRSKLMKLRADIVPERKVPQVS